MCGDALDLDAVEEGHVWYCSPACAQGLPADRKRQPAVPEPRLYHRPRRFFRRRAPKELRRAPDATRPLPVLPATGARER